MNEDGLVIDERLGGVGVTAAVAAPPRGGGVNERLSACVLACCLQWTPWPVAAGAASRRNFIYRGACLLASSYQHARAAGQLFGIQYPRQVRDTA